MANIKLGNKVMAVSEQQSDADAQKQELVVWQEFFKNIGAVATLGASISFALIPSSLQDPKELSRDAIFSLKTVRLLLSISWLLFMVTLSLSFSFAQRLADSSEVVRVLASQTVYLLDVAAVLCLALIVAAYVEAVGYLMVALITVVAVFVILETFASKLPTIAFVTRAVGPSMTSATR